LRRLTVCRGGFDLDDALAVCTTPDLTEGEVVDHLWALVDCSLVEIDPAAGETRYRLLTIVRRHVEAGADETDLDGAWTRLGDHLREVLGPECELDRRWITRMAIEIDNVRAVVDHPATPVAVAQALAWAVGKYHDLTDGYRTGIAELERCASQRSPETPELVAILTLLADLHLRLGDHDAVGEYLDQAAEAARSTGPAGWDSAGLARARADLALRLGDVNGAIEVAEAELRNQHSRRASARLWNTLGIARGAAGDMAGAVAAFESELADATMSGTEAFLKTTHGNLAEAKLQLGDRPGAAHHQLISLELARAHGHPMSVTALAFSMMIAARLIDSPDRYDDVVRLQTVADEILATKGFALFANDDRMRSELLDAARSALGTPEFERLVAEARAADPDAAAELATEVLNEIRSPAGENRRGPPQ
jgi:tetratricopeptide (TPR) repeat protein